MQKEYKLLYGIHITDYGNGDGVLHTSNLCAEIDNNDSDYVPAVMPSDVLESFLLALASEGVNIGTKKFKTALETTVQTIANKVF